LRKIAGVLLAVTIVVSACSGGGTGGQSTDNGSGKEAASAPKSANHDPITLKLWTDAQTIDIFKNQVSPMVTKVFPYISFEYLSGKITDLVAAGDVPDLYSSGIQGLKDMAPVNLQFDMADLIKKNNLDLSKIDPGDLNVIKNLSANFGGQYYGVPIYSEKPALMYNRALFDKFGVAYPKDGLTWDDAYELSKKMTRTDQGVSYRGMTMNLKYIFENNQLSASYFDPKQNKAAVTTDKWKSIFTNMTRYYMPPMEDNSRDVINPSNERDLFMKAQTAAMYAGVTAVLEAFPKDFNSWDVVSIPTMKEAPGLSIIPNSRFYYITGASKHKDEAFDVLKYMLGEEFQMAQSKLGKATVLMNSDIRKAFGQDSQQWQGKHTEALFYLKSANPMPPRDSKLVEVGVTLVSSEADLFSVQDLIKEFELETQDAYLERTLAYRHAPVHME
jgi:multiple sugar transport system substrate-binding protein